MTISNHGMKRIKERVGVTEKGAQNRLFVKVLNRGLNYGDIKDNSMLRSYYHSLCEGRENGEDIKVIFYGEYVYVMNNEDNLITTYMVPNKLKKLVLLKWKEKKVNWQNQVCNCGYNKMACA